MRLSAIGTRRPTIRDVARAAGVSKSTVSLVLKGDPGVRADTARSVHAAIAATGYVYDARAANLRLARPGPLGFVCATPGDPLVAAVLEGATEEAAARTRALLFACVAPGRAAAPSVAALRREGAEGVLLCGSMVHPGGDGTLAVPGSVAGFDVGQGWCLARRALGTSAEVAVTGDITGLLPEDIGLREARATGRGLPGAVAVLRTRVGTEAGVVALAEARGPRLAVPVLRYDGRALGRCAVAALCDPDHVPRPVPVWLEGPPRA
ncbi:LacI family DNA-binding transcriptional regulator [Roseivivax isoporae]|uniref:HTH lacI-type domain-containing protein n=1 Tax=Roseivivax isoporae LMG 25204 TaxID=1449351 RepID=X7F4C3_9RHOB|nr:LacI family DNA-binding transcriptional regulator [Roseivivax isoporae]ETX27558.1 hypothetical protein RISW2_13365 [Roseivivax isoporae LMG 25204]